MAIHFLGQPSEDLMFILLTVISLVLAWGWKEYIFLALDKRYGIKDEPGKMFISMVGLTLLGIIFIWTLGRTTNSCHLHKEDKEKDH